MRKINSKKGDLMSQLLMGLIIIMVVTFLLISVITKFIDNSRFEAEFISRDLSLLIDTIYASPNDITIRYPQKTESFSYEFSSDGKISIIKDELIFISKYFSPSKDILFVNKTLHPVLDVKKEDGTTIFSFESKDKGFVPLKFSKKNNIIEPSQAVNIFGND